MIFSLYIACLHLKQTRNSLEMMSKNESLPQGKLDATTLGHSLKNADPKKKKRTSPSFQRKSKQESIPLQAKSTAVEEHVSLTNWAKSQSLQP